MSGVSWNAQFSNSLRELYRSDVVVSSPSTLDKKKPSNGRVLLQTSAWSCHWITPYCDWFRSESTVPSEFRIFAAGSMLKRALIAGQDTGHHGGLQPVPSPLPWPGGDESGLGDLQLVTTTWDSYNQPEEKPGRRTTLACKKCRNCVVHGVWLGMTVPFHMDM